MGSQSSLQKNNSINNAEKISLDTELLLHLQIANPKLLETSIYPKHKRRPTYPIKHHKSYDTYFPKSIARCMQNNPDATRKVLEFIVVLKIWVQVGVWRNRANWQLTAFFALTWHLLIAYFLVAFQSLTCLTSNHKTCLHMLLDQ